jgi:hypothetical protein
MLKRIDKTIMKKNKGYWMVAPAKGAKLSPAESDKKNVTDYFHPLVESFKKQYILKDPNKEYNYLVDVYSKWNQNYFYLCEKHRLEHPNGLVDEFEEKFVRLKYTGKDQFEFSYFRHTGKWHVVAEGLSLEKCREMIVSNPVFHPVG